MSMSIVQDTSQSSVMKLRALKVFKKQNFRSEIVTRIERNPGDPIRPNV